MAGPNNRHFVVYDLETSNLMNEHKDGPGEIVQISAEVVRYQDYELHPVGRFSKLVKPQFIERASPKAIEIIGKDLWEKSIEEGVHPKVALKKFRDYLNSVNPSGRFFHAPILVGFNSARFDDPMLFYWMKKYKQIHVRKDDEPWAYMSMDLAPIFLSVFGRDNLKNNKLETYAEMFGITRNQEEHNADEDVFSLTTPLFQKWMRFTQRIRPKIKVVKHEN